MFVVPSPKKHVPRPWRRLLRSPCRPARDGQMRADDRVRAQHAVLDRGQVHRAALAAHQPVVAASTRRATFHRRAARQGMGVAAVRAKGLVSLAHRDAAPAATAYCPRDRWLVPFTKFAKTSHRRAFRNHEFRFGRRKQFPARVRCRYVVRVRSGGHLRQIPMSSLSFPGSLGQATSIMPERAAGRSIKIFEMNICQSGYGS